MSANPDHRTSRRTLRRLAEAHVFYELGRENNAENEIVSGPWDKFSTRNLGLRVNRRMSREFGGEAARMREASVENISRSLNVDVRGWSEAERRSLENWSLILGLIPRIAGWTSEEKQELVRIIRSQSGRNEMEYLRHTQRHPRLRAELLRLGSA
ncbi:MAG: hypothetical protein WCB05_25320, partial [Candidatus Sulfotelmatobacter sp.]